MNRNLLTYWIEVDRNNSSFKKIGVTAFSLDDAFNILKDQLSVNFDNDLTFEVTEDISFDELDHNHVVPNMGPISERGIWYPRIL